MCFSKYLAFRLYKVTMHNICFLNINNTAARPRLGENCRNIKIPNLIAHYQVKSEKDDKGRTRVRFLCREGYILLGQRTSVCKDDVWSGTPPVCQGIVVRFNKQYPLLLPYTIMVLFTKFNVTVRM